MLGSYSGHHVLSRVRPAFAPFITLLPSEAVGNVGTLGFREGGSALSTSGCRDRTHLLTAPGLMVFLHLDAPVHFQH